MAAHWTLGVTRPTRVAGEPPWDMAEREQLIRAKAAELVTAGAKTVREESYGEHLGHVVMLDPKATSSPSRDRGSTEAQRDLVCSRAYANVRALWERPPRP